jgi:SpoVK/Ycf46/Vps4 family AAA+-type ATPase
LRRSGINILLYGTTGTGKTELARLLAAEVGSNLYVANAANPEGESASARERLSSLLLGQRLVGSGLLLFDELEDLFTPGWHDLWRDTSRARPSMSKQWFNDLLESNPIPTLWITNSVEGIDPAFLRRFTYAVEFRSLGPRQRARVLARHIADESAVSPSEVDSIAERFSVSPAQLGSAVAATRMIRPERPDRSTLERVLEPLEKLTRDGPRNPHHSFDVSGYRIDALNSPDDLSGIVDRLASWTSDRGPGVSLCLYGPPGTGKSAYVQYLAHRMGRPVLYRHCSDILGCFVGETEKQIARAFRQAEEEEAVLLFDEVDSFLCDRRGARQSWEVTQVNEFLQQLESFRGVVACTTNLWHALDEASLRRFVFKIEFRYLEVDQAIELFHATFAGCLAAPLTDAEEAAVRGAFARVRNLAPGDFAAVARRERALGRHPNAAALVASLTAEVGAKPGASRRIGF